jgi:hypothetical protein
MFAWKNAARKAAAKRVFRRLGSSGSLPTGGRRSLVQVRWLERPILARLSGSGLARRRGLVPRKPPQHRKLGHGLLDRAGGIALADASHPIAFDLVKKIIGGGWGQRLQFYSASPILRGGAAVVIAATIHHCPGRGIEARSVSISLCSA